MSIFSVGQSALNAAQAGITTTGHNIANANTPGYSRQQIVQTTNEPQLSGGGYFGQGVRVTTVKRVYDDVLQRQALDSQGTSNASNTYATQIGNIDKMLSDPSAGLTPALKDFFSSLSKLAANPGDTATRQTVLSASQSLSNRFNSLGTQLADMQTQVNSQITNTVSSINTYTTQIAELNMAIEKATSSSGQSPNDLLDQRDNLVTELSKLVKTTVTKQGNDYNVFIGNGLPVVVGKAPYSLSAVNSVVDPTRTEVAYTGAGSANAIQLGTNSLTGGILGGLLDFRSQTLDNAQNQLGQIATVLAYDLNAKQAAGQDFSGNTGAALSKFFNPASPATYANTLNTGNAQLNASIANANQLSSSNYQLTYNGTNYILTRLSDNTQVGSATSLGGLGTVDGLTFNFGSGAMNSGDSFIIKPTVNGATSFSFAMTNTNQIAAASASATANSLKGDGSNALLMNQLENQNQVSNGTTSNSYSTAFSQMVAAIGVKSNEMKVTYSAESNALSGINSQIQSQSGVNLDEEAANLMRYQQSYQAASKLMQIANQMFSSLLNIAG